MGFDAAGGVFLRPGEGETIFDGPERTIRILADRDELALTWFRLVLPFVVRTDNQVTSGRPSGVTMACPCPRPMLRKPAHAK